MEQCWDFTQAQRPTFKSLAQSFEDIRRTYEESAVRLAQINHLWPCLHYIALPIDDPIDSIGYVCDVASLLQWKKKFHFAPQVLFFKIFVLKNY